MLDVCVHDVKPAIPSTTPSLHHHRPPPQESVAVLGYPIGGDSLAVSAGVVSRVQMTHCERAGGLTAQLSCLPPRRVGCAVHFSLQ